MRWAAGLSTRCRCGSPFVSATLLRRLVTGVTQPGGIRLQLRARDWYSPWAAPGDPAAPQAPTYKFTVHRMVHDQPAGQQQEDDTQQQQQQKEEEEEEQPQQEQKEEQAEQQQQQQQQQQQPCAQQPARRRRTAEGSWELIGTIQLRLGVGDDLCLCVP